MIINFDLANGSYLHQLDLQVWTGGAGLKMVAEPTLEDCWWDLKDGLTWFWSWLDKGFNGSWTAARWNLEADLIMNLEEGLPNRRFRSYLNRELTGYSEPKDAELRWRLVWQSVLTWRLAWLDLEASLVNDLETGLTLKLAWCNNGLDSQR